jgi:histone H3/H4
MNMAPEAPESKVCESKSKRQHTSKATKAGLVFSISRIDRRLRQAKVSKRVSSNASVYLTGVVEHVLQTLLAQSRDEVQLHKTKRITFHHIIAAVRSDPDLSRVFKSFCFTSTKETPKACNQILCNAEKLLRMQKKTETKSEERPIAN